MNIGVDFDGVILDDERAIRFYADFYSKFKLNKSVVDSGLLTSENRYKWNKDEINEFYDTYYDKITEKCSLFFGAKEILTKLHEDGHKIYLITTRGFYREEEMICLNKKLDELGFKFDDVICKTINKIDVCKKQNIDVMIDDNPEMIMQFLNSNINAIYFKMEGLIDIDEPNVYTAFNWIDIYNKIKEIKNKI